MTFFNNMTIRVKFTILLGLLFFIILAAGITIFYIQKAQKQAFEDVTTISSSIANEVLPISILIKEIQIDVIQIQQWLTDISATRGLNGLNDGFQKAEEHEKSFFSNIEAALTLAKTSHLKEIESSLLKTKEIFPSYYDAGKKMASTYVEFGTEHGNGQMGDFDKSASAISESLNELLDEINTLNEEKTKEIFEKFTISKEKNSSLYISLIASLTIILSTLITIQFLLKKTISNPIRHIFEGVLSLSKENYSYSFTYANFKDELGQISSALENFKNKLAENVKLKQEQEQLEYISQQQKRDTLNNIAQSFESELGKSIQKIAQATKHMKTLSQSMSQNSNNSTQKTEQVTKTVKESAESISAVAGATEELSASISEISSQVLTSSKIANQASEKANAMSLRMQTLVKAVEKIGEVIILISTIAEQTNLLALNATIEAARAGDAGKGFTVVASEVKSLATETAQATKEISEQINQIQSATKESEQAISEILEVISNIDQILCTVSSAIEEQGAATNEIARNVQQASQSSTHISHNMNDVVSATQTTGTSANEVLDFTEQLTNQTLTLNQAVETFTAKIKNS